MGKGSSKPGGNRDQASAAGIVATLRIVAANCCIAEGISGRADAGSGHRVAAGGDLSLG